MRGFLVDAELKIARQKQVAGQSKTETSFTPGEFLRGTRKI
jgi:hypothetical protein